MNGMRCTYLMVLLLGLMQTALVWADANSEQVLERVQLKPVVTWEVRSAKPDHVLRDKSLRAGRISDPAVGQSRSVLQFQLPESDSIKSCLQAELQLTAHQTRYLKTPLIIDMWLVTTPMPKLSVWGRVEQFITPSIHAGSLTISSPIKHSTSMCIAFSDKALKQLNASAGSNTRFSLVLAMNDKQFVK